MGKILDTIPADVKEDLIDEVKEELKKRERATSNKVDPDILAFAKKRNEEALKKFDSSHKK